MKNVVLILLVSLGLASFVNAQDATLMAISEGATELASSKTSGEYEFVLPSTITKENIDETSKYYTASFTVDFDEDTHVLKVNMVENSLKSRYVMARLLTANGLNHVQVDDKDLELYEFIEEYLK